MPDQDMIPRAEAVRNVRLMARRTALLYYYFATTLVEAMGEDKAKPLIARAIQAYGEHCGRAVREGVEAMGLPATAANFGKVADLPALGWEGDTITLNDGATRPIVTFCPLAAIWQELGAEKLGRMYCYVDQAKYHAYNPDYEFTHTRNVLDGDDWCEFCVKERT